jgi:hypothetical protein
MKTLPEMSPGNTTLRVLAYGLAGVLTLFISSPAGLAGKDSFPLARFKGIYEPSGIEHNGSLTLIIEDEKSQPLHLLKRIEPDGSPVTRTIDCGAVFDDSEGIASNQKYFYIAGSHHTKDDGSRRRKREFFARLDISGPTCRTAGKPVSLYDSIQRTIRQTARHDGPAVINIEALAWKRGTSHLYVALRAPLFNDAAVLLSLTNPEAIFSNNEPPQFSEAIVLLQLSGGGIRAMNYIEGLDGYLIANETRSNKGKMRSRLWYWKGEPHRPEPVELPGFKKLDNVEGLAGLMHESRAYVAFVSDDGKPKKDKGAHFALVPMSVIKTAIDR